MPTTLLRGSTGASRRTSARSCSLPLRWMPTCSGSPISATALQWSAGMPRSSTSPVTTPNWGSSPVVNLAIRTPRAYRRTLGRVHALPRAEWTARAAAHEQRVDAWVRPHLERRRRGQKHPVHDFLFTYYSQRPAALRRWHPGYGVALLDAPEYADLTGYSPIVRDVRPPSAGVSAAERLGVSEGYLRSRQPLVE